MKRFCISSVLFLVAVSATIAVAAFFLPDRSLRHSLLGMQTVKLKRLHELQGHRIIFVGGSNLSHGLCSQMIEDEFGVGVVNMGVHAGLGLRYILWATIDDIRADDSVVIVPEYGQFGDNFFGNGETLAMVCDIIPVHKRLLSARQWLRLVEFLPRYGAGKLCRLGRCFLGDSRPPLSDYNVYGDRIPAPQEEPLPSNKGFGRANAAMLVPETIRQMNEYIARCRDIGAEVVFLPPVFQRTSYERQLPYVEAISKALAENGTPFIVPPEQMVLDDEFFYDTPYHLNIRGYPVRTRCVMDALRSLRRPAGGSRSRDNLP